MPRILGVDIPNNKKVEISLRYIYGIGPRRATEICEALGFDPAMRAQNLSEEQLNKIVEYIVRMAGSKPRASQISVARRGPIP